MPTTRFKPLARWRWFSIGPVAEFAQAVEEHRPRQGVSGLALVQADVDAPAKLDILQVFQREEGAFDPAEFPQRHGQTVLPRVGPELAEHERRRDGALLDRGRQAQDLVPVGRDLLGVERRADEALQRRVAVRFLDGGERACRPDRECAARIGSPRGGTTRRRGR